ncbi:MAG: hypothetical protein L3K26_07070 [Candidatus Hydrogenedentes bacterium]|nr:hypothetical protein [Candidatus Hydrogenedentota bacterium]
MIRVFPKKYAGRAGLSFMVVVVPVVTTLAAAGLVLCICHDGHVSIEANCASVDCCPEEACLLADNVQSRVTVSNSTPLHSCVDLSFDRVALEAALIRSDEALILPLSDMGGLVPLAESFSLACALPVFEFPALPVVGGDHCARTVVLTV